MTSGIIALIVGFAAGYGGSRVGFPPTTPSGGASAGWLALRAMADESRGAIVIAVTDSSLDEE
jgi:hypothetical protein